MSALLATCREGRPVEGLEIIDMHTHLGRYQFAIPDLDPGSVVAVMDRLGVAKIVASHMRCMSADTTWGNDQVLDAMRRFPGRILGYASFWPTDARAVAAEAERRVGEGFTGFKLHNTNGFPYTHESYRPVYVLAHERRMPVLFHVYGEERIFAEILQLAAEYPEIPLIMAHAGAANCAEGYIRTARAAPNVLFDTCLSAAPWGLVARLVAGAGAEKVLWGSDALFYSQAQQFGRILGANITEADKRQILSGNPRRILDGIRR